MVPGATAFTGIPRFAYSMASDLVAASKPPFVSDASTDGHRRIRVIDQACRHLHDMTAAPLLHFSDRKLRHVEEPSEIDVQNGSVVGVRVLSERLGDENAGVVNERVDAPKPTHRLRDDTVGRIPSANIAGYCHDAIVRGRLNRSGRGDHLVIAIAVCIDEGCADALRRTRDDGNLLHCAHRKSPTTGDRSRGTARRRRVQVAATVIQAAGYG
jgi:hypothetical protein